MKTRPARPGASTVKKLYDELDQLRQNERGYESTAEFLSGAYRHEYGLDEWEALPSSLHAMARKLIMDFKFKIEILEGFQADTRCDLVKTAWAAALFLIIAVGEGMFIWIRILGGVK